MGRFRLTFVFLRVLAVAFAAAWSHDARALERWMLFHYSQGVISYRSHELDVPYDGSASATTDLIGGELRLRDDKSETRPWLFTGSLKVETERQLVLGNTFTLPRGQIRLMYAGNVAGSGAIRIAPLVHLGAGKFNVLRVTSAMVAPSELILRESGGAGAALVWRIKTYNPLIKTFGDVFEFSAYALARYDAGSAVTILPNPLLSSLGYEAGASGLIWFGRFALIEVRWRSVYEAYEWVPAGGGSSKSDLINVNHLFDFGLGFRF